MEVHYRSLGGRLVVKVDGASLKEVLKQIGPVAELLDADTGCGKCGSANIYPNCRSVKSYDYYSLVCSDCGAALNFGQRKDGGLWPKRKDGNGNVLDHRGWAVYLGLEVPKDSEPAPKREAPAARPAAAAKAPEQDDPELAGLLARLRTAPSGDEQEYILAEVFEAIETSWGLPAANAAWEGAVKRFGHPKEKGKHQDVARYLWAALHPKS